jgi:predicted nucleic acid-binding protein
MDLAYLIDTDWVIHHLGGHPTIIQRLQDLHREGLGLSVIALAELYEGVYYARDPEQSEARLAEFLDLSYTVGRVDADQNLRFAPDRGVFGRKRVARVFSHWREIKCL